METALECVLKLAFECLPTVLFEEMNSTIAEVAASAGSSEAIKRNP